MPYAGKADSGAEASCHPSSLDRSHEEHEHDSTSCVAELAGPQLPAFLLWAQGEPQAQPGRSRLSAAHKQHIASLLTSYEAQTHTSEPLAAQVRSGARSCSAQDH